MIAVIILLVGSRMIKMLVKMVRRFLERGKVEAGCGFLSEFFCEICALFCAGNDYSGAVWRDDKLCDCRAGVSQDLPWDWHCREAFLILPVVF